MCTPKELYRFMREQFLHSRFEGSPHCKDYPDYPYIVTAGHHKDLLENGTSIISHFESRLGRMIIFDENLKILNPDEPPIEIEYKVGNLTHIF